MMHTYRRQESLENLLIPPPDNFVRRIIGYHGNNNKVQQKGYAKISICEYLYLFIIGISGTTFLNTIFWWKNQKQQQHSKSND